MTVVYVNTLTAAQKDRKIPIIIRRDGNVCFYCKMQFVDSLPDLRRVIDHANNNPKDNRVENLLLSHSACNERKKYNSDYHLMAKAKLEENLMEAGSLGESVREKNENMQPNTDELTEGDINLIANKLVKAELSAKLPEGSDGEISYTRILRSLHYLLIGETGGRGSEPAIRRALDAHCSEYAPWMDEKRGRGNRVIRRRKLDATTETI